MNSVRRCLAALAAVMGEAVARGEARVVKDRPEAEEGYAADRHETKAARKRRMREVQRKAFKGE